MVASSPSVCPPGVNLSKNDGKAPPLSSSPSSPPPAPPLPICVQKEVPKLFSDETMSFDDMVKEAEAKIASVQMKTRDLLLEMANGGGYRDLPFMARFDGDWLSKMMDVVSTDVQMVMEKMRERACEPFMQEPKFVMQRTMRIKFLDPASFASSPEGRELEKNGWVWV